MADFNWADFFAMGGHGFYVWTSFGIVGFVMLFNVVIPLRSAKRLREEIRHRAESLQ